MPLLTLLSKELLQAEGDCSDNQPGRGHARNNRVALDQVGQVLARKLIAGFHLEIGG